MNWTVYIPHISGIIQFLSFCDRFISLCVMLSRSIHVTNGRLFFKWQPTPVFLSGESHGQRSLVGYSSWGHKESDTTERLHFHFLFSILLHVYISNFLYPFMCQQTFGYFHVLLLWIMLQWRRGCRYLYGILISILLDIHPGMRLLYHIVLI